MTDELTSHELAVARILAGSDWDQGIRNCDIGTREDIAQHARDITAALVPAAAAEALESVRHSLTHPELPFTGTYSDLCDALETRARRIRDGKTAPGIACVRHAPIFHAYDDARARTEAAVRTALTALSFVDNLLTEDEADDATKAAVRAAWPEIESTTLSAAAGIATAVGGDHADDCHGRTAALQITGAILTGESPSDHEDTQPDPCSTVLEFETDGIGLADIAARVDEALALLKSMSAGASPDYLDEPERETDA